MRYFCIAGGYRWQLFHTSSSGVNSNLLCLFKASAVGQSRSDRSLYNSGNCNVRHLEVSRESRISEIQKTMMKLRKHVWACESHRHSLCWNLAKGHIFQGFISAGVVFFSNPFPFFTLCLWLKCMKVLRVLNDYFGYKVEMENEWYPSVNFHSSV